MTKSKEQNTPIMNVSKIKMAIKNSFTLTLTLLMQERIQMGVMKVVKTINNIEIPSTPSLNLIKSLIQDFSSTNWKFEEFWSKECQTNKDNKNVAMLVNKETYIALLLFWLLDIKIKIELTRGKNIKEDKIGKFILV